MTCIIAKRKSCYSNTALFAMHIRIITRLRDDIILFLSSYVDKHAR